MKDDLNLNSLWLIYNTIIKLEKRNYQIEEFGIMLKGINIKTKYTFKSKEDFYAHFQHLFVRTDIECVIGDTVLLDWVRLSNNNNVTYFSKFYVYGLIDRKILIQEKKIVNTFKQTRVDKHQINHIEILTSIIREYLDLFSSKIVGFDRSKLYVDPCYVEIDYLIP